LVRLPEDGHARERPGRKALKVIALIDGEHHPAVTRDALALLAGGHELCAVLFVGGEEKVPEAVLADSLAHFGVAVTLAGTDPASDLRRLADGSGAAAVVDLSGEPVLDGPRRHELAAAALDRGLEYRAGGLVLTPPPIERLEGEVPIVGVIGTSKRCGKTAVAGHLARLLSETGGDPVIVAMGRGGPPEPTLVRAEERTDRARLLAIARAGGHAASDYLEGALLAGVTTIGCRRCGEGPAGEVFDSSVVEGARLALTLEPGAIVLEGSGAAFPPIAADRNVCVVRAPSARADALSFLGPFRLLRSHLVLLVGADEVATGELAALKAAIGRWCPDTPVIGCTLEPEPAEEVPTGTRVAVFTTASAAAEPHIRARLAESGVDVQLFSSNLARRDALARDIELAVRQHCDLFLTELKAAAVDTVAEQAERRGVGLVFLRNRPQSLAGEPDLDAELLALHEQAAADRVRESAVPRS
jgi:cyclic 2,3-diphosphoglycerate synthase